MLGIFPFVEEYKTKGNNHRIMGCLFGTEIRKHFFSFYIYLCHQAVETESLNVFRVKLYSVGILRVGDNAEKWTNKFGSAMILLNDTSGSKG